MTWIDTERNAANKNIEQLYKVSTLSLEEHQFKKEEQETVGGLSKVSHDLVGQTQASHRTKVAPKRDEAGDDLKFTTFGCEACWLKAEEKGVEMPWDPTEARRNIKIQPPVLSSSENLGSVHSSSAHLVGFGT